MTGDGQAAARRLLVALDLFRDGEALMRQNLRRRRPGVSDAEIDREVVVWARTRPGATHGDCPGRPVPFDR